MKVCKRCGTIQQDDRFFCIECGEKLEKAVSEAEEQKIREEITENIENQAEAADELGVDKRMRIAAVLDVIGVIFAVVSAFVLKSQKDNLLIILGSLLFYVISFVEAIFPNFFWTLTKLKIWQYANAEDIEPSFWYGMMRKIGVWGLMIYAYAAIIFLYFI